MRGLVVDYCGVLDGAEEDRRRWRKLLEAVKAEGIKTAIMSNVPGGASAAPIRAWQEAGFIDNVILSGEVGVEKPNPEIFEIAGEQMDIDPRDLVLVDDSIVNVRGAVDAGLVGVYYQQFDRAVIEIQGLFDIEGDF